MNTFDPTGGIERGLRSDLAICKNWTEDFDGYVTLPLGPQDSVVALVGRIKNQPYYN